MSLRSRLATFARDELRSFLGINQLERDMAISTADQERISEAVHSLNERVNATTSRLAVQLREALDKLAGQAAAQQAADAADLDATTSQVNALLTQLDGIGRDASDPVPAGPVDTEPGPDVSPVESPGANPVDSMPIDEVAGADVSQPGPGSAEVSTDLPRDVQAQVPQPDASGVTGQLADGEVAVPNGTPAPDVATTPPAGAAEAPGDSGQVADGGVVGEPAPTGSDPGNPGTDGGLISVEPGSAPPES